MATSHSTPLVTAVIPTYRRPKILRRAIRSVLNQTYPQLRVCVYDNASGDETSAVVADIMRTDDRLEYHCHPTNIGPFNNFKFGMEHVETPFFSLLSDDDLILPGFYQQAMEMFSRYPDAIFFAGETIRMDDNGRILAAFLGSWPREGYLLPRESLPFILGVKHPTWTAIVFRTEVLKDVGSLDPAVSAPSDLDFMFRAAARFPIIVSKMPCAIYVHHRSGGYESAPMDVIWPGWLKMIRNLTDDHRIPEDLRAESERLLTELLKITLLVQAIRCLRRNDLEEADKAAAILAKDEEVQKKALAFSWLIWLLVRVRPARVLFLRFTELVTSFRSFFLKRTALGKSADLIASDRIEPAATKADVQ